MAEPTPRPKTCACCGGGAGTWPQWWNRDTGYGVCSRCASDLLDGRLGRAPALVDFERDYGREGVHWARTP